ncbi:RNA polymerase sigma factor, sigma-70 family protein 2 [Achromobacter xylosoxidans A8]|uniref:RNA polymerase sigma factor, sigma-70 family protein 2 n=1 Tax=Achromobacter xylosoxidans (strain A8) TaxID=762376 RepID=E3HUF4_ACHXA|nr:sigma-70 family RNA polymerase sigma factor [Achromobacter xylosoxidans]ADP13777.1 RNA polymerase sigma factor, sigma-70 family protein 2 [Achromobacter xylosoxidans A8]
MSFLSDQSPAVNVESLYCNDHRWLQGWLRRKLGNAHDAADLAHDTFLRILSSQAFNQHYSNEPRALLTHIAKGLVVDHWRRKAVETAYLDAISQLPAQHAPSAETRLLIIEALVRIDTMLAGMTPRIRQVFLMAQLHGMTLAQISEHMTMSLITVRRDIQKALLACLAVA